MAHGLGEFAANVAGDVEALSVVDRVHDDEGVDGADPGGRNVGAVVHAGGVVHFKTEVRLQEAVFLDPLAIDSWNVP